MKAVLTSEAFLSARVGEEWGRVVGAWVGAELELGVPLTSSSLEAIPAFPGEQVEMDYSFEAKRFVPCTRGGVERRCVELELKSVPDPEAMKRVISTFMSRAMKDLGGDELGAAIRGMDIETGLTLITEPDGLLPHSFTWTKTIRVTALAAGQESSMEQIDTTRASFTWK